MKVELVAYTPQEVCIEAVGICVGKEGTAKALRRAIESGHESVIEHSVFSFRVTGVSRVLLAQLTRHRLASYSVQSQRYVDSGENDYYYPEELIPFMDEILEHHDRTVELYMSLRQRGVSAESARYVLPQSIATEEMVTMNARELRHVFELRCCNRAQEEIRMLADEMYRLCMEAAPLLFAGAGPGCMTPGGCREARPCGHPRAEEFRYD